MDHVAIRRELVTLLTAACAPVRVVDEEADAVAGPTVVVCWVGCDQTAEGWAHRFEERIILTGDDAARPHFAERDNVAGVLVHAVRRFANTERSWKSDRVGCAPGQVTVGGAQIPALVCRHIVHEPLKLD